MEIVRQPSFLYAFLQFGVLVTFMITAVRAWKHSCARFVELVTAFLFGLLLEQGDIFLFGTYRYNENWILLGDVPIAIALTWALIIVGAMNITDALGIRDASSALANGTKDERRMTNGNSAFVVRRSSFVGLVVAPMADAVWAILLDLAIDAVAIRLGLWTWTIRADEGWFGVPWGNFFAWLFVAFWFSFFTRLVRVKFEIRFLPKIGFQISQWLVPFLAFFGLIATLVPFIAIENTAALPFVPDNAQAYNNQVWIVFALTLAIFVGVTLWAMMQKRAAREAADHWLLLVRLVIHGLFLLALLVTGIYLDAPLLLVVAAAILGIEVVITRAWFVALGLTARQFVKQNLAGARLK